MFNPERTVLSLVAENNSSQPAAQIKLHPADDRHHWRISVCRKQRKIVNADLDITFLEFLFGLEPKPHRVARYLDSEGANRLDAEYFLPGYGVKTTGYLALFSRSDAYRSIPRDAVQLRLTDSVKEPIRELRTMVMESA